MSAPRILAFSGSLRAASFNHAVVGVAGCAAAGAGAEVTTIRLADHPLPLFNEDLEAEGAPEGLAELKQIFKDHDGFLIGCPEYNGGITAALKNTIDWLSRPAEGEPRLACFTGKYAGLVAASPGPLGGIRGLPHVRTILCGIGCTVLAKQAAVGSVHSILEDGAITDERMRGMVEGVGRELAETLARMKA